MINVNGLVVEKRVDGSVVLRKYADQRAIGNILSEHVLSHNEWESIVGTMEHEEGLALAASRELKDLSPTVLAVEADRLCQAKKQREDALQAEADANIAAEARRLEIEAAAAKKRADDAQAESDAIAAAEADRIQREATAKAEADVLSASAAVAPSSEAGAPADLTSAPEPVAGASVSDAASSDAAPVTPVSEVPST